MPNLYYIICKVSDFFLIFVPFWKFVQKWMTYSKLPDKHYIGVMTIRFSMFSDKHIQTAATLIWQRTVKTHCIDEKGLKYQNIGLRIKPPWLTK